MLALRCIWVVGACALWQLSCAGQAATTHSPSESLRDRFVQVLAHSVSSCSYLLRVETWVVSTVVAQQWVTTVDPSRDLVTASDAKKLGMNCSLAADWFMIDANNITICANYNLFDLPDCVIRRSPDFTLYYRPARDCVTLERVNARSLPTVSAAYAPLPVGRAAAGLRNREVVTIEEGPNDALTNRISVTYRGSPLCRYVCTLDKVGRVVSIVVVRFGKIETVTVMAYEGPDETLSDYWRLKMDWRSDQIVNAWLEIWSRRDVRPIAEQDYKIEVAPTTYLYEHTQGADAVYKGLYTHNKWPTEACQVLLPTRSPRALWKSIAQ
jgi:hypothetical protein